MKFSLIMATLGRTEEIKDFLLSLSVQTDVNYELIIVDQNSHDEISNIIRPFESSMQIKHIKSGVKGLSRNRNIGLKNSTGEIIAFPDDDCQYSDGILSCVNKFFCDNHSFNIFACNTVEKGKNYGMCKLLKKSASITRNNVMSTVNSNTLFVRLKDGEKFYFDEIMGVGEKFGAAEETDFTRNLLYNGYRGLYFVDKFVYHPAKKEECTDTKRIYSYSLGFGAEYKKDIFLRKNYIQFPKFIFGLFVKFVAIFIKKNRFIQYYSLKGRIDGFIRYPLK